MIIVTEPFDVAVNDFDAMMVKVCVAHCSYFRLNTWCEAILDLLYTEIIIRGQVPPVDI